MKGALQILERALSSLVDAAGPGVTPRELADLAGRVLESHGAGAVLVDEPNDAGEKFGFAACVCVNDATANAVPTDVPLAPGDLVTIDVALAWPVTREPGGAAAIVDGATTCIVPGRQPLDAINLRDAARAATSACILAAQPGVSPAAIREVARAVASRFGVVLAAIPLVHRVQQGQGPMHIALADHMPLQPGDVIAIEPLMLQSEHAQPLVLGPDGFTLRTRDATLGAYEECTMVVGDDEATPRTLPPATLRPWLIR